MAAVGLTVMIGWWAQSTVVVQISPDWAPMQFNTALCFFLVGAGMLVPEQRLFKAHQVIYGVTAAITGLTLLQYLSGINLGIDELFHDHDITVATSNPGRMAPNTAIAFLCFCISELLPNRKSDRNQQRLLSFMAFTVTFVLATAGMAGYLFNVDGAYGWGAMTQMAAHTAITLLVLTIGVGLAEWTTVNLHPNPWLNWLPIVMFFIPMIATCIYCASETRAWQQERQQSAEIRDRELQREIQAQVDSIVAAMHRYRDRWFDRIGALSNLDLDAAQVRQIWMPDAEVYLRDISALKYMAVAQENTSGQRQQRELAAQFAVSWPLIWGELLRRTDQERVALIPVESAAGARVDYPFIGMQLNATTSSAKYFVFAVDVVDIIRQVRPGVMTTELMIEEDSHLENFGDGWLRLVIASQQLSVRILSVDAQRQEHPEQVVMLFFVGVMLSIFLSNVTSVALSTSSFAKQLGASNLQLADAQWELSEQLEQEQLLKDRLDLALTLSETGSWYWTATEGLQTDDRMRRMLGRPEGLRNFDELFENIHPDDQEKVMTEFRGQAGGGETRNSSFRILMPDGSYRHLDTVGHEILDSDGKVVAASGVMRDVTAEKNYESLLEDAAKTDSLTGLNNRRAFDEFLATQTAVSLRSKQDLSLIMIDVDYFKPYNDTLGHVSGDRVLQKLADIFREVVQRPGDFVARYGGEEFSVIMPMTELEGAQSLAERLRESVEKAQLPHPESPISQVITISLGCASFNSCVERPEPKGLILAADRALYDAKAAGRNQYQPT